MVKQLLWAPWMLLFWKGFHLPAALIWSAVVEVMCVTAMTWLCRLSSESVWTCGALRRLEECFYFGLLTGRVFYFTFLADMNPPDVSPRFCGDQTGWFKLWRYFSRTDSDSDVCFNVNAEVLFCFYSVFACLLLINVLWLILCCCSVLRTHLK